MRNRTSTLDSVPKTRETNVNVEWDADNKKERREGSMNGLFVVGIVSIVALTGLFLSFRSSRAADVRILYVQTKIEIATPKSVKPAKNSAKLVENSVTVPETEQKWKSIDKSYRRKISPGDEKFVLSQELIRVAAQMSLDLRMYGWSKRACTYDPHRIKNESFDLIEWESHVSTRIAHALGDASDELSHEVASDIRAWRLPLDGSENTLFHSLSVIVRTNAEDFVTWKKDCLDVLMGCANVYHVFVSFGGDGIEEAVDSVENSNFVTFVQAPKEIGTRFFFNTTWIKTPFILSLDGDRCARCDAIRQSLKALAVNGPVQDRVRIIKVVAGWVSLRGLTPFLHRHNPNDPPCRYFPDWYGTRPHVDFAAYFLPTNAVYAKRYLEYYRDMLPNRLINFVNDLKSCEDLLMSFFQTLFQFHDQQHGLTPFVMQNGIGYNITDRKSQAGKNDVRPHCLDFMLTLSMKFGVFPHALAYEF